MVDGTFDGHGFGMVMVEVGQWGEVLMNLSRWFGLGGLVLWCMMRYCESIFLLEINWILGSNYMWACLWAFRLFQLVDGIWLFKKFVCGQNEMTFCMLHADQNSHIMDLHICPINKIEWWPRQNIDLLLFLLKRNNIFQFTSCIIR